MTQRDIEPLREICLDLGISALMARWALLHRVSDAGMHLSKR